MATKTTKLAGPDRNGNYKVLTTKGHLQVKPGEVYTERHVKSHILRQGGGAPEVTFVEAKFDRSEIRREFGTPVS